MPDENFKKYISHIEETCGEEKDIIAILKYETKDEAINKILEKGNIIKSISNIVYEISFGDKKLRLYRTGKILMKNFDNIKEAEDFLNQILNLK